MSDAGVSSEVKKRKGPSAEYQARRRAAIKAGEWKIKARGARKVGGNTPVAIEETTKNEQPVSQE